MDQQPHPVTPPTPEEIARLEAEAVREAQQQAEPAPAPGEGEAQQDWNDVPYVDDVPAPEPDDEEYVPTDAEKRIAAIPEGRWNLYTALCGAALGVVSILILTLGNEDLGTWSVILAVLIALLAPRYLERWWRRPMPRLRTGMLIAMVVTLAVTFVIAGLHTGFRFFQ